jgi:hypothetical protein
VARRSSAFAGTMRRRARAPPGHNAPAAEGARGLLYGRGGRGLLEAGGGGGERPAGRAGAERGAEEGEEVESRGHWVCLMRRGIWVEWRVYRF